MPTLYRTRPGEVLDDIVWRHLGRPRCERTRGQTEAALALNPGLRHYGPRLPGGLTLLLPDPPNTDTPPPQIKLWD